VVELLVEQQPLDQTVAMRVLWRQLGQRAQRERVRLDDDVNVIKRLGLYAYNHGAPIGEAGTVPCRRRKRPTYGPRRSAQRGVSFSF
jgi:hypothetical protein